MRTSTRHEGAGDEPVGSPTESASRSTSDEHRQDIVSITVDGSPVEIHRGSTPVTTIKEKGNVPAGYELALETPGVNPPFKPLPDGDRFTIKGGEAFLSYPKDSGSSHPEGLSWCRAAGEG